MPHRADIETTANTKSFCQMRKMHAHHQQIRNTLVALVLEVVLGEPEGVEAEAVHANCNRLGFAEHRYQVIIVITSVVGGCLVLTHVTEIDMTGIE